MTRPHRLGHKLRRLRRQRGLTQARLAKDLGISASYLNLLEHNRRPVTVPLLLKLAQRFDVELQALAEDDLSRLVQDLMEVFGDGLFEGADLNSTDVEALVDTSPEVGRAVRVLYEAYRSAVADRADLAERLADGTGQVGPDVARLPSEEVSDFLQAHLNHFAEFEEAAADLLADGARPGDGLDQRLVDRLERRHGVSVSIVAGDEAAGVVRRFDPDTRRLALSEVLPPRSRLFQLAHQVALLEHGDLIDARLAGGSFTTPASRVLARVALANYVAGAVLMPYDAFLKAARSVRYDIEVLGHRFRTSFEQVCHRLTTLNRPGARGVPFHFVRVDVAGNISKRFSASGIRFARYSGACPRWNVFSAFLQPGFIRTQLSSMPDGTTYFCIARTVRKEGGGFRARQSRLAIGLGCEVEHARELVYADGVDLENLEASEPIGISCRLCERTDCRQRAVPPLQQRLDLDENVRGLSFYITTPALGRSEAPLR